MNSHEHEHESAPFGRPDQPPIALSPAGERRRRELLGVLERELRTRTRRRKVLNAVAVAGLLGLAFWGAIYLLSPRRTSSSDEIVHREEPSADAPSRRPAAPPLRLEIVGNDPTVIGRCLVPDRRPRVDEIDDEELDELLRAADRTGLIRVGDGRTLFSDEIAVFHRTGPR